MVSLSFILTGSVTAIRLLSSGLAPTGAISSAALSRLLGLEQDLLDLIKSGLVGNQLIRALEQLA